MPLGGAHADNPIASTLVLLFHELMATPRESSSDSEGEAGEASPLNAPAERTGMRRAYSPVGAPLAVEEVQGSRVFV